MFTALERKEKKISVTGLGYVGLPLALAFAKKYSVIGFDISPERVELMCQGIDPSKELESSDFANSDIQFTSKPELLQEAHFHIITVPTPVDDHKVPDLKPLLAASETVGKVLKPGDYIIYESTVYPGCTEEDCVPVLEKTSGLTVGKDFKVGYSPERINPGDKKHTLTKILKIVAGSDAESLQEIEATYASIIEAGVYKAASIKVAEAAKVIENTQRDINIALMNELSMIFDIMDIDTKEVLEAAGTKWNFLNFYPGLVGGHCIGVDPYYLTYKAEQLGYTPQMILSGRKINDRMPAFVAKRLVQKLIKHGKSPQNAKVLIMGVTFKENVADIRNSKVADLARELMSFSVNVHVVDPHASPNEVAHEYGLTIIDTPSDNYDAVVVAVSHKNYLQLDRSYFEQIMNKNPILADLKGIYSPQVMNDTIDYWRL